MLDYNPEGQAKSDSLPPVSIHLLKVPELPKTAPLTGEPVFKYTSLWGTFLIRVITMSVIAGIPLAHLDGYLLTSGAII